MPRLLRVIVAVLIGFAIGSTVNMGLVMLGGKVIAPPSGADVTTLQGLKTSLHLFEPKHFLFPFLANGLGTLAGAFVATVIVPSRMATPATVVGGLFLLGGIANTFMLPGPVWFNAADLLLAYLPAAWAGLWLARRTSSNRHGGS